MDAAAEADIADDIDLDDCPDEFLDPLMDTLMNDPVNLPCKKHTRMPSIFTLICLECSQMGAHDGCVGLCQRSGGTTIDRVTIERSLLDNEINPFSREPMTVDDLVPNGASTIFLFVARCLATLAAHVCNTLARVPADALKERIFKWVECRKAGVPFDE